LTIKQPLYATSLFPDTPDISTATSATFLESTSAYIPVAEVASTLHHPNRDQDFGHEE